jgi:DNA-binding FrmR family transcriptional regulator
MIIVSDDLGRSGSRVWQARGVDPVATERALPEARHRAAVIDAWHQHGDPREVVDTVELSAMVSTNRVYRLVLDDQSTVIAKTSNYGSFFLFAEDHDRLHRCNRLLRGSRYEQFLADALTADGRPDIFYDGEIWAVFYNEVPIADRLPRILSHGQVDNLADEIADFHLECAEVAPQIPATSKTMKSDAIHLLDSVTDPHASQQFGLDQSRLDVVHRHTHRFLMAVYEHGYDYWQKIPVLIDWNLGNFSVEMSGERFRLFSRWDYDWFRVESRVLDFYFLSRVSSRTGDRTRFTYGAHTMLEPRFKRFLRTYHRRFPLTADEVLFLGEAYRFFLLNYVVREGRHFFRHDIWRSLQHDVVDIHLPMLDSLDLTPLLRELGL